MMNIIRSVLMICLMGFIAAGTAKANIVPLPGPVGTPETIGLAVNYRGQVYGGIDLFTSYPFWDESSAAEVSGGRGVWKVNEEHFTAVVAPNLAERHSALDLLPIYTPGVDPNRYWLLIEDDRIMHHRFSDDWVPDPDESDQDFEDLQIHVVDFGSHVELTFYRGYTWYDFDIYDSDGPLYYDVGSIGNNGPFTVVIPEPATMSLLALGGLAMLRRRRA